LTRVSINPEKILFANGLRRVIQREDARSLSSGAHSRDPLALLPGNDDML